eukprot:CAMPEP_0201508698 /NCGR_PEP_ID=MMETSP0161_2-20130828/1978_1 /ASSEMBLY_ACC=CAM_ASM_000251 /TAXON_ID=180227 /ORGANISM="Neoparamoeba aestuarina, Strain SoJaBio B1-5/56/2" /LENGTH=287 /DNA_ID=CAMNT_0047903437 /DNA_START=153 /DNA_END=1013 /DNA_ORIENTATION=-
MAATPRPAATVIVAVEGEDDSYQILFVKRHKKARFMPSAHVFPGGVIEKSDRDARWRKRITSKGTGEITDDEMFRIGAIRELFEESNILFVKSNKPIDCGSETIQEWRKKIQKDSTLFFQMSEELDFVLDTHALKDWARWITPEMEKYRYDTYFYFGVLTKEQASGAAHCQQETVAMEWLSPEQALDRFKNKKMYLAPPTWINVLQLSVHGGLSKLVAFLNEDDPLRMVAIKPEGREHPEGTGFGLLLAGDKDLPESKGSNVEHRAFVDVQNRDIEYRWKGKVFHSK